MIVPNDVFVEFYLVFEEFKRAKEKYPDFTSIHNGYAAIKEKFDELCFTVKKYPCGSRQEMKKDASHVAATAIRFMTDLCR